MGCKARVDKRSMALTLELDDETIQALSMIDRTEIEVLTDSYHHVYKGHFRNQEHAKAMQGLIDELADAVWPD
jgi:hypothetical protein